MPRCSVQLASAPRVLSSQDLSHPSPILELKFFHTAIRSELEKLHQAVINLETGSEKEIQDLFERYCFLRKVYRYHSSGEDEVILPALDLRVKNVAGGYSLEHRAEVDLFEKVSELLMAALQEQGSERTVVLQKLICSSGALLTCLAQHLSKEEEQVLPLLIQHFSAEEQAMLVWQFLCCIPINLMQEFLPWMASFLSEQEVQEMVLLLRQIVPSEELRRQVLTTWLMKGGSEYSASGVATPEEDKTEPQSAMAGACAAETPAGCAGVEKHPINELIHWHNAIRKELDIFSQEAEQIKRSRSLDPDKLAQFTERFRFLADVCFFHSTAEDKVVFLALEKKVKLPSSYYQAHADEEKKFVDVGRLLEGLHLAVDRESQESEQVLAELCSHTQAIVGTVQDHLMEEELHVIPLVQSYYTIEEQRILVYQSLREMPLRLLERVLPWVVASVSEEEAADMVNNMRLAAPEMDSPLVRLFSDWVTSAKLSDASGQHPVPLVAMAEQADSLLLLSVNASPVSSPSSTLSPVPRPSKRLKGAVHLDGDPTDSGYEVGNILPSLRREFKPSDTSVLGIRLGSHFERERAVQKKYVRKPIDTIFQFHDALRTDLEYLATESAKLADADQNSVKQFCGHFQFLRGLYKAHSNAEDDIVFPALESKEALHNVSHSYMIDHKQEEEYFEEIAVVLEELQELLESPMQPLEGSEARVEELRLRQKSLGQQLHSMCSSVRYTLDHHVSREELELWPLFEVHFSVEEQDQIVGRIIGTTGAEVLQAMLPWISKALSEEDQKGMINSWRQATRNTMFDQWLSAWWKDSPSASGSHETAAAVAAEADPSDSESLQMVVDYFQNNTTDVGEREEDGASGAVKGLASLSDETADQGSEASGKQEVPQGLLQVSAAESLEMETVTECVTAGDVTAGPAESAQQGSTGQKDFKPGWQDIFRMNQQELEQAIRKLSSDKSLDPRRKAYLMQNLMTSRWIVAQQKKPSSGSSLGQNDDGSERVEGQCPSYHDEPAGIFGCEHYRRNCKLKAACCGQLFPCRFCHDKVSDHTMDRHTTQEMMCMKCLVIQPVAQVCATSACHGYSMARYFCSICKLLENDESKPIYHCPFCNLCRVGRGLGVDYFHCMACNVCMALSLQANHVCRERGLESNCPICHDFLFTSNTPVKALPCGHFMHSACFQAYTCGHYTCPVCWKSLGDMAVYFGMLDALLASEELPEEYRDRQQDILCNDCGKKTLAPFHWLHHKCKECGSYNTKTI